MEVCSDMGRIAKIIIGLFFFGVTVCFSQWSTDPAENNIVASNVNYPVIVADMENGIIEVAQTHAQYSMIFAQRMSVDGYKLWPGNEGVPISSSSYYQWFNTEGTDPDHTIKELIISDGAGGCYVGFQIGRFVRYLGEVEIYDTKLYLQRLDANGNRLLGPEGLALMPDEVDSTGYTQKIKYLCPDGYGGVYVIFWRTAGIYGGSDKKNGIYLTRISAVSKFVWGPSKLPAIHIDDQFIPYLDSNLNLNLYYYPGETLPLGRYKDKFFKINSETGEIISEREIEIGVGEYGFNAFYDYCFSSNNSAIFAFHDFRTDTLRIQKIDSDGNKLWGDDPIIIDIDIIQEEQFDIKSDQYGGAYVFYNTIDDTFHLAHFDSQGIRIWDKTFYSKPGYFYIKNMISVGGDGSVFVLMEKMKYLTKLSYGGKLLWETMVSSRDTIATNIWNPRLQADNIGGCIVLWKEGSSQFIGLRAQRIDRNGNLGGPTTVSTEFLQSLHQQIEIKSINPNPFNDSVTIRFSLFNTQQVSLKVYNILGKEVSTIKSDSFKEGEHVINWQGTNSMGQPLTSGVYFLVLQAGSAKVSKKILLIR